MQRRQSEKGILRKPDFMSSCPSCPVSTGENRKITPSHKEREALNRNTHRTPKTTDFKNGADSKEGRKGEEELTVAEEKGGGLC